MTTRAFNRSYKFDFVGAVRLSDYPRILKRNDTIQGTTTPSHSCGGSVSQRRT